MAAGRRVHSIPASVLIEAVTPATSETILPVTAAEGHARADPPGQPDHGARPEASVELDLYKLAVEMADRISARRALANTFFLTVNTGLAAVLGGKDLRWYVAAAGIVFSLAWWWLLQSYRKLNAAKFAVINSVESRLPLHLFSDEWEYLKRTRAPARAWPPRAAWAWLTGYHELGTVERIVPFAFAAIYVAELIRQATN
jgi:hypothetical protein